MMSLLLMRRWMARAKRWIRVAAYAGCVAVLLVFALTRVVWGSVGEAALDVGSRLAAFGEALGPSYRVLLNGAQLNVASATTELGVTQVLDRYEQECREHAGGLAEEFQKLTETLGSRTPPIFKGPAGVGIIRKEAARGGVVACLARDGTDGLRSLADSVQAVERTGDVSALGHLRFVTAQRRGPGRTHVVSVWSDGPLHVGEMFPADGDAPGVDPGPAVRPPDAKRVLSASVEGAPFGIQVYVSSDAPDTVFAHYDREMASEGWEPAPIVPDSFRNGRVYRRGGVDLMVLVERNGRTDTTVSILSMPPR